MGQWEGSCDETASFVLFILLCITENIGSGANSAVIQDPSRVGVCRTKASGKFVSQMSGKCQIKLQ